VRSGSTEQCGILTDSNTRPLFAARTEAVTASSTATAAATANPTETTTTTPTEVAVGTRAGATFLNAVASLAFVASTTVTAADTTTARATTVASAASEAAAATDVATTSIVRRVDLRELRRATLTCCRPISLHVCAQMRRHVCRFWQRSWQGCSRCECRVETSEGARLRQPLHIQIASAHARLANCLATAPTACPPRLRLCRAVSCSPSAFLATTPSAVL
jgi:hypothetical protein